MNGPLFLRPFVWFVTASIITTIAHELTHACVAYALGVGSVLSNYSVSLDPSQTDLAVSTRVLISLAGPTFCLAWGLLAWLAFTRARDYGARLPLLLLSVFGVGTFFGNLMSTSFVGDFSSAANLLEVPMTIRYALSGIGVAGLAVIHFRAGCQLVKFVPQGVGAGMGLFGMVLLPVILGTAAIVLVNQPATTTFASARFVEGSFWLFAVLGALMTKGRNLGSRAFGLRWFDCAMLVAAILLVRLLMRGIEFPP